MRAAAPADTRIWKPAAAWYSADGVVANLTPPTVEQSELRFQLGDDPRWAAPDWDDSGWQVINRNRLPLQAGIFWLRLRVRTLGPDERVPSLLIVGDNKAHDLYVDGALLYSAGVPANAAAAEVAPLHKVHFELPPGATTPGEHVLALRMSSYRRGKLGARFAQLFLHTVPPEKYHALDSKLNMLPAMGVGSMLTIAIAGFVLWAFAARQLILLLLAALCLSAALLIAIATAPAMWVFPASWFFAQSLGRVVFVVIVSGLLVGITLLHFYPARRRWWLLLPLFAEAVVAWQFVSLGAAVLVLLWRLAFAAVFLTASVAAWRRREGAWWVISGVLVTALLFEGDPGHFDMTRFVIGFLPILVGLIAAIALQVRRERRQARDARLTAARLEIELLRKSLQPHFLLNTLTALSQVLEEKPAAAVRLIEDLAAEFRSLNRLSTEKQVPLAEELALCRAHLRVMSARTERAWTLETAGVDPTVSVPPALFLTLIENGFSHQRVGEGRTAFLLRAERTGAGMRYTFLSPGAVVSGKDRVGGGLGLRYVRSRLEESFHGAWSLTQREVPGGWETVIDLGCDVRSGAMV